MTHQPGELLLLRLDALESDVAKVRVAVDRAKERGRFVGRALDKTASLTADISFVAEVLESLVRSIDKEPELDKMLAETTRRNLTRDLRDAPELLTSAVTALEEGVAALKEAKRLTVILNDEGLWALQTSLERRCDILTAKVDALRLGSGRPPPLAPRAVVEVPVAAPGRGASGVHRLRGLPRWADGA